VAGPYDQSHAHQDQGSFTFFKGDWLAVTQNIWSHSGIHQETEVHNVLRFVRGGAIIPRNPSESVSSSMTYTNNAGLVTVSANLANAYSQSAAFVQGWTRKLEFQGDVLRIEDRCTVASGVQPVFQLQLPSEPIVQPDGSIVAGGLRVVPLHAITVAVVSLADAEFSGGYRLELSTPSGCAFDVELRAE